MVGPRTQVKLVVNLGLELRSLDSQVEPCTSKIHEDYAPLGNFYSAGTDEKVHI